ncbi:hypothetical protein ROZALSC1DRAFT_26674 [Rozella allomycis CSF55]|uniref:Uncharacterized protein n=1 Tax=Rozella allomycis (strain CSF55) TaxID=988480 RepID=A0A075B419_ROZAC|nr:hypothetical protein O9G_004002 [Rozella allomycis CSF55]RKP21934.1 hypothetical protein ROZALSC1DRAFT_26674 [Rozella allomycis CSF55]|eukprot:EPZ35949.1 hypothetical protein O9G_004002 [Rozella allomycis CSF55]
MKSIFITSLLLLCSISYLLAAPFPGFTGSLVGTSVAVNGAMRDFKTGITFKTPVKDEEIKAGQPYDIQLNSYAVGSLFGVSRYRIYIESVDGKTEPLLLDKGALKKLIDAEYFLFSSQHGKGKKSVIIPKDLAPGKYRFIIEKDSGVPGFKNLTKKIYRSPDFNLTN